MKRILIIVPSFELGGTNTSLNNLLTMIDYDKESIDVMAIVNEGPNRDFLESYANVVGYNNSELHNCPSKFEIILSMGYKVKKIVECIGVDLSPIAFRTLARKYDGCYDLVIGFQEGQATLLASFFKCEKWAWVHCELMRIADKLYRRKYSSAYSLMDKIICVSNCAKDSFIDVFPSLISKVFVINNFINPSRIIELSKSETVYIEKAEFTLISVGRIDPVKRFRIIPSVAREITDKGYNIKWYIVGSPADSKEYEKIKAEINGAGVESVVQLLGAKVNPYPYIASCDLLACLSSSETFNYTIAEARCLGVPVITTDIPASYEFIKDGETGIISSIEAYAHNICSLIDNKELYLHIKENTNSNLNNNIHLELLLNLLK